MKKNIKNSKKIPHDAADDGDGGDDKDKKKGYSLMVMLPKDEYDKQQSTAALSAKANTINIEQLNQATTRHNVSSKKGQSGNIKITHNKKPKKRKRKKSRRESRTNTPSTTPAITRTAATFGRENNVTYPTNVQPLIPSLSIPQQAFLPASVNAKKVITEQRQSVAQPQPVAQPLSRPKPVVAEGNKEKKRRPLPRRSALPPPVGKRKSEVIPSAEKKMAFLLYLKRRNGWINLSSLERKKHFHRSIKNIESTRTKTRCSTTVGSM